MPRSSPNIPRRGLSPNAIVTIVIVVVAVLVIGGVLLFNRSSQRDDEGGAGSGEIPAELRVQPDSNTLTTTPGNTVTLVEFLDFQCPACAAYYEHVTNAIETDYAGRITFVTRNFPIESHPLAQPAARVAEAAAKQGKYREMYHTLYDNYQDWAISEDGEQLSDDERRAATFFDRYATEIGLDLDRFRADRDSAAVQERIDADQAAGQQVGVTGTPTFFVNGKRFHPSSDQVTDVDKQLRTMLDEAM
ncbi:thioredoxin [Actinophytocola xinjiangensis]|uniref:Thioredoxin n=1 Tax=Actinophytocola xinjiangensis TaxID=485602 RepID=A0A7Z0WF00_9PSEU|nr:thioredoxin domain-containing protein [Actinophytocola xinjiangensis]OLF05697.1 thioredoxin [Actinophytocola xinjiangensis]